MNSWFYLFLACLALSLAVSALLVRRLRQLQRELRELHFRLQQVRRGPELDYSLDSPLRLRVRREQEQRSQQRPRSGREDQES